MASHADHLRGSSRVPAPREAGTRDEPPKNERDQFCYARGTLRPNLLAASPPKNNSTRPLIAPATQAIHGT